MILPTSIWSCSTNSISDCRSRWLFARRLDCCRNGDQSAGAFHQAALVGPVGVKTGAPDQLDIPDVFALSSIEFNVFCFVIRKR